MWQRKIIQSRKKRRLSWELSFDKALYILREARSISFGVQLGSIRTDPCPIGLIILPIKATNKKNDQFFEAISCRTSICPRGLNFSSNGAIDAPTAERLRFRRQGQRNSTVVIEVNRMYIAVPTLLFYNFASTRHHPPFFQRAAAAARHLRPPLMAEQQESYR